MLRAVDAAFFVGGKPLPYRIWKAGQFRARPKCLLRTARPKTKVQIRGKSVPLQQLMAEMMLPLRTQLLEHSNLGAKADEKLEAMLGVPANANSNAAHRAHLSAVA